MSAEIMITYQPQALRFEDWSGRQMTHFKPRGVWYSPVEGSLPAWRAWCRWENWSPGRYTKKYRLENLHYTRLDQALTGQGQNKILLLEDEWEVIKFATQFKAKKTDNIDWQQLASLVAGIEVNPYQHGTKHEPGCSWYGWWDVASGCIWRKPDGIVVEEIPLDWGGSVGGGWGDS